MANPNILNFNTEDGIRAVEASEQGLITFAGAKTLAKLTILGRITASGKYGFYDSGASDGTEVPVAVLMNQVEATAAGDKAGAILLKGKVRTDKLVIDGNNPGVGITNAVKDALRTFDIIVEDAAECAGLDNQ